MEFPDVVVKQLGYSFGGDVFKARQDYRQMALDIYTTAITSEHLGENDAVNGCKLAESLLLNLRGSIDEVLSTLDRVPWS